MQRHAAALVFLALGALLLYALWERVTGAPCGEEYAGWVLGNFTTGAFALYFLSAARLAWVGAHAALGIATLWAWQLFVLSPILGSACGTFARGGLWLEPPGLSFLALAGAIVLLAVLTSIAIARRYGAVPVLALAALVSVPLAAGSYLLIPGLREMYAVFGADLPAPTLALLQGRLWIALLPLAFVGALLWVRRPKLALGFLVAANLLASGFAFAAYAPMLKMCSCV